MGVGEVPGGEVGVGVEIGLDVGVGVAVGVGADDVPHAPRITARTRIKAPKKAVLRTFQSHLPRLQILPWVEWWCKALLLVACLGFPQEQILNPKRFQNGSPECPTAIVRARDSEEE